MVDSSDSPYIHSANEGNFREMVLENSKKGPVLVNFWSKNADACIQQYPVLDEFVQDLDGRVLLVNVDTKSETQITHEYDVTNVPLIKLFRNEQVVKTLNGHQASEDLMRLIEPYIARESDKQLADAIEVYAKGDQVKAYEIIAEAILGDPINPRLPLTMCKLLKYEERYKEARELIESLPDSLRDEAEISGFYDELGFYLEFDPEKKIQDLLKEMENNPNDQDLLRQLFVHYMVEQEYDAALKCLLAIMDIDRTYQENYAMEAMLKVFNILGEHHPLSKEYRLKLRQYTH